MNLVCKLHCLGIATRDADGHHRAATDIFIDATSKLATIHDPMIRAAATATLLGVEAEGISGMAARIFSPSALRND